MGLLLGTVSFSSFTIAESEGFEGFEGFERFGGSNILIHYIAEAHSSLSAILFRLNAGFVSVIERFTVCLPNQNLRLPLTIQLTHPRKATAPKQTIPPY